MGEISAASHEQSSGVAQVGEAITQMDQATQQNAALVEESAAAAQGLRNQAESLLRAISRFQLERGAASLCPLELPLRRFWLCRKAWLSLGMPAIPGGMYS